MATMQRWKLTSLAAAAAISLGMYAPNASALALGRITVQSALGEPLRAEVDLPEITAAEAESLRTSIASPDVYRSRGVEYSSVMNGVRINVERRNGRTLLALRSDRPVNDPFVDLILEASWSSGKIVRDYTLLFDPPNLRQPPAAVTVAPQIAPSVQPSAVRPRGQRGNISGSAPSGANPVVTSTERSSATTAATAPTGGTSGSVTVKAGDTASRIASANKPASVSLDQMLVAMLRANPDAFVGGNVNRIRSGAVIDVPDEAAIQNTSADAARQFIVTQSRDFNDFRRKLASNAPSAQVAGAERSSKGAVSVQVDEGKQSSPPDRLTLSNGTMKGQQSADAAAAEKITQQKQARAAEERKKELDKNMRDLQAMKALPGAASSAPATTTPAPAPAMPAPATPVTPAASASVIPALPIAPPAVPDVPVAVMPAPPASNAPMPAEALPAPAVEPQPVPVTPAPSAPEAGMLAGLMENPLLPILGGALLALLAGLGIYKVMQRRRSGQVDSSFLESRLQPDSFFGASGGQRVDTNHDMASSSSMAYSPSQLDAGGDVDPVAEADVYLAYGRDLQAEEILKEALRTTPNRVAVHVKLLEIYAKRNDDKTFETVASEAFRVTKGEGPEWDRICELGRQIDPSNRLYQPGGLPAVEVDTANGALAATLTAANLAAADVEEDDLGPISANDLDLDLDIPSEQPIESLEYTTVSTAELDQPAPAKAAAQASNGMEFTREEPAQISAPTVSGALESQRATSANARAPVAPAIPEPEMLDFDVDSLSFDVDTAADVGTMGQVSTAAHPLGADDPLTTKLALAEEFNAIGDADGARALAEEVAAEATGDLKARAQRLLAEMG